MDFDSKYTRAAFIESGSFGEVCRVIRNEDGVELALKTIHKSRLPLYACSAIGDYPVEVKMLRDLEHPHIIRFVDSFEDAKSFLLVMELVHNSIDLYDFTMKRIDTSEEILAYLFAQIADALFYLHCLDIVHLDMKLENVVTDEDLQCKLVDFGSAAACKDDEVFHHPRCSEPACSPEIWSGRSFYGKDADCWALGVLLYRLCYRETPFISCDEALSLDYVLPDDVSPELDDLFSRIFHERAICRANAWEIRHHRWAQAGKRGDTCLSDLVQKDNSHSSIASVEDNTEDGGYLSEK
ncbi:unnamed protein product [Nippostrongylus brasiliensis]|uniref:Protein kinase domain-containing protein n=1 Tax=Nippostrongylus brasiliensis TaxID=27835 RepID=A0A158R128_NIPBR|nr:unnamed protein product [Nippostrongylus brasiliensis]